MRGQPENALMTSVADEAEALICHRAGADAVDIGSCAERRQTTVHSTIRTAHVNTALLRNPYHSLEQRRFDKRC
jgi:hypothetical protein